jgi:outer membrane biosynthesis protein TonB
VLLSAGVVVIVGALALGFWAIFFKDEGKKDKDEPAAGSIAAEREAEYGTAIRRAQDAYSVSDWLAVREYAIAALQVKPNDVMATSYQKDATIKLEAAQALARAAVANTPPIPAPPPVVPVPPAVVETPPPPVVTAPPVAPPPPQPRAPPPKPKPKPPKPRAKGMSDADAQAQFERAIDAFRSKDNDTGCELLDRVADRAPADSPWKSKAETLYLKRCGG